MDNSFRRLVYSTSLIESHRPVSRIYQKLLHRCPHNKVKGSGKTQEEPINPEVNPLERIWRKTADFKMRKSVDVKM